MSLVSASGFIGGIKEYAFHGMQQLPLVMTMTSFLFTITTGSIAHATMTIGLGVIMPLYTVIAQQISSFLLNRLDKDGITGWTRSTVDVCHIVPSHKDLKSLAYYSKPGTDTTAVVPGYWIISMGFFFGYVISNALETLQQPAVAGADPIGHEKRNTQAMFLLAATIIMALIFFVVRFYFMSDCEGRGATGKAVSVFFGLSAYGIGAMFYTLSRACGARSSDLFGVLSQILPASATSQNPVVCSSD